MLVLYSNHKINQFHFTKNKQKSCRRKFVIYFYYGTPNWKILLGLIGLKITGLIKFSRIFAIRNFKMLCIKNLSLYEFILVLEFRNTFFVVKLSYKFWIKVLHLDQNGECLQGSGWNQYWSEAELGFVIELNFYLVDIIIQNKINSKDY